MAYVTSMRNGIEVNRGTAVLLVTYTQSLVAACNSNALVNVSGCIPDKVNFPLIQK